MKNTAQARPQSDTVEQQRAGVDELAGHHPVGQVRDREDDQYGEEDAERGHHQVGPEMGRRAGEEETRGHRRTYRARHRTPLGQQIAVTDTHGQRP